MILMFGASSDIGIRATKKLLDRGHKMRLVARDPTALDSRAELVAGDISCASSVVADADAVISCAHARFTKTLIESLNGHHPKLVLVGSAWRYSGVAEEGGEAVRAAEAIFLNSRRDGVMLHPTMIYAGKQENNLGRLLDALRRSPILPLPGGGINLVQPIHVDDVAECLVAAATRNWEGPHIVPICGPKPMRWRDMAALCAEALGRRIYMVPVPLAPAIAVLSIPRRMGFGWLDPNILRRLREDVSFSPNEMIALLGVSPRDFASGIRQFVAERSSCDEA